MCLLDAEMKFRHLSCSVPLRVFLFVCLFVCGTIFFKVLRQISMKLQDMIEDHQSKSKFEVQEFRSKLKVKVTKNIKNTLLIITSFLFCCFFFCWIFFCWTSRRSHTIFDVDRTHIQSLNDLINSASAPSASS